ncbi:potassium channel family protein [Pseudomonas sp. MAP12]|uniref:Potassium channel family protein n=1 Tax=Geopseudomonas aromaticivorans TaxID=2849492 RepID=A0ABS6MSG6_9GAMM|nr:potassium channel family protein [Pseudomonas aromaticivorans]MBV2131729.1 potassium channel family protein [Pseudomonas aromaticivorans]
MLLNLLVGLPVMLLCLVMEAFIVAQCLRYYVRYDTRAGETVEPRKGFLWDFLVLGLVMLLMMLGYFVQIGMWAGLFMLLGEFEEFATSAYYSGVTFATLGYGDIVLSTRWRLLGALEAGNGVLMLGISTGVMTAAVKEVIKHNMARPQRGMNG